MLQEYIGQSGTPGAGPWMRLIFQFDGCVFTDVKFETYGCPTAIRCGDWVAKWAVGKTPEQVEVLEAADLIVVVGGVPLGKEFCADLAVDALRDGLTNIRR